MNSLYTRCPHCATVFRATGEQLEAAGGRVRCGACQEVFDARVHEVFPEAPSAPPPGMLNADYIGDLLRDSPAPPAVVVPPADATFPPADPARPTPIAALPVELGGYGPRPWTVRRIAWLLGIVVLVLALFGQYLWLSRASLVQDPRWRTSLEQACASLGCALPPYRDPASIRSTELLVRPDPAREGVLLVDTVLHNSAPFAQRYPGLELSFTDMRGKAVARRVFGPREYLGAHPMPGALLAPREPVRVHLELKDPGEDATNYELRLIELESDDVSGLNAGR